MLAVVHHEVETGDALLELVRFDDAGIVDRRVGVTHSGGGLLSLEYSADGRFIGFVRETVGARERVLFDVEDERTIGLTERHAYLWSPVGSVIAFIDFVDGEEGVWIARSDDGMIPRRVPLPEGTTRPDLGGAVWSPDGSTLAFRAVLPEDEGLISGKSGLIVDEHATEVRVMGRRMHPHASVAHHVHWSPDSTALIYAEVGPPLDGHWYLVRIDDDRVSPPMPLSEWDGSSLRWLTPTRLLKVFEDREETEFTYLDLSDEGATETLATHVDSSCNTAVHEETSRTILVCGGRPPRALRWWDPELSESRPLDMLGTAVEPSWSPDASRLSFVGRRSSGATFSLFEIQFPSGEVTELQPDVRRWRLDSEVDGPWSPRGDAYFVNLEPNGLAIRDLASPTLHVVGEPGSERPAGARGFERALRD